MEQIAQKKTDGFARLDLINSMFQNIGTKITNNTKLAEEAKSIALIAKTRSDDHECTRSNTIDGLEVNVNTLKGEFDHQFRKIFLAVLGSIIIFSFSLGTWFYSHKNLGEEVEQIKINYEKIDEKFDKFYQNQTDIKFNIQQHMKTQSKIEKNDRGDIKNIFREVLNEIEIENEYKKHRTSRVN